MAKKDRYEELDYCCSNCENKNKKWYECYKGKTRFECPRYMKAFAGVKDV